MNENMQKIPIVIVSAISRQQKAIGYENKLLWHIPEDLKHFKELTLGHPIIMGKKTFASILEILGKPLPGRTNIVLTRDKDYAFEGVKVAHSLEEAIDIAKEESPSEIHIGGGATLYKEALPLVSRLHITWVYDEPLADTFFPPFEDDFKIVYESGDKEHNGLHYEWTDYERKES